MATATVEDDGKIECKIDGARVHSIKIHIDKNYPGGEWSVEKYLDKYGKDSPLLSAKAETALRERREQKKAAIAGEMANRQPLSSLFGLPPAKTLNPRGQPITVAVFDDHTDETLAFVPDTDKSYVYNIELLKSVLISYELNKTIYLYGYHGSGKTTVLEQVAARTKRPFLRLQHTINTEESHIVGQWTVKDGQTVFQLGPLPMAMQMGLIFCADEYDRALPSVSSVYQAVLEGKPLMIKEAPPEMRIIRPHKNFRFVATGNTNGCGDDTGLYQGTQVQDAANYSRFAITEEVFYPEEKIEAAIVAGQSQCKLEEATKLVKFANEVRKSFAGRQISSTISPRELINAAFLGMVRGGDWRMGLRMAFANRLSRTDREVCDQFAQRLFG
jgi:cobaltochelatase CobS